MLHREPQLLLVTVKDALLPVSVPFVFAVFLLIHACSLLIPNIKQHGIHDCKLLIIDNQSLCVI